jgi:hypothetical protein
MYLDHTIRVRTVFGDGSSCMREMELVNGELHQGAAPFDKPGTERAS